MRRLAAGARLVMDAGRPLRVPMRVGDVGTVKIRASRLAFKSATLADVQDALLNQVAFQIIDKGPASS